MDDSVAAVLTVKEDQLNAAAAAYVDVSATMKCVCMPSPVGGSM